MSWNYTIGDEIIIHCTKFVIYTNNYLTNSIKQHKHFCNEFVIK